MTSNQNKDGHRKHAQLTRPAVGYYGRTELAFLGTPCGQIKKLAFALTVELAGYLKVAYVDADHKGADGGAVSDSNQNAALGYGAFLEYTDKITFQRYDYRETNSEIMQKPLFQQADVVLVNGNHFPARIQVAVIDPVKSLEHKLNKLTNVQLILLAEGVTEVPSYLQAHLPDIAALPVFSLTDTGAIAGFIQKLYATNLPPLKGLVLAGGQSTRMQQDKGLLEYHGQNQRHHVHGLLSGLCTEVFVSCNHEQADQLTGLLPYLEDRFLGLGPKGGLLTALQSDPNAAWLAVACDLPFLSAETLQYLVDHRDPTKMATAFYDSDGRFPEPMLTIWEPRSYGTLLQFLAQGYSCPRKALINSDIKLLEIPQVEELRNVNDPEAFQEAKAQLKRNI